MDIQVEKLQLIEWLARLNNTTILKQFIALKKETKTGGIRLVMKKNQKIEEGLAQANRGEVIAHKEVMANTRSDINNSLDEASDSSIR